MSALAWEGYQEQGRGVVHVIIDKALEPPPGVPEPLCVCGLRYCAVPDLPDSEEDSDSPRDFCERYDPETELVAVMTWWDAEGTPWMTSHWLPTLVHPPQAHERHKAWLERQDLERQDLQPPWSVGWFDPDGHKQSKKIGSESMAEKFRRKKEGELAAGLCRVGPVFACYASLRSFRGT